jgi:N-acetylglucosamine kinase-like BadF-type ATPase
MTYYLGYDGGGTKTEAILLDARGHLVGRGLGGPSNAMRIGFDAAFAGLRAAAESVLSAARADAKQVHGVCAGLAGAGGRRVVKRMMAFLVEVFPRAVVHVTTDAAIALETATQGGPGVILIAGTGSIALGRNAAGHTARAGGLGPWLGDEGSAFDVGRRALVAIGRARDALAPVTLLSEMVPTALEIPNWEALLERVSEKPHDVLPRIFPLVVEAADLGDDPSREILFTAALGLSQIALSVARRLNLAGETFTLATSGGVFGHSQFLDNPLDALIRSAAPRVKIQRLEESPALGAARWAMRLVGAQGKAVHGARA